ncbi:zinc-binding dehydrogenase [Microbulbifer hydrolyticus]|uniref:2-desacetyl-2-hydroxyethyl bacteriochlorophyllide A dehydrogenase n=1 Tax=Microbulbifer hydrolyticus TaxID=48074 RepID=A0A6P1T9Q1_9GAMM|nr:zinc-binding dehydrogenase [Microbulbifer hydrolyticus]MBB5210842.1 2-desacetyl-2-hydroxyethyl bacteriochlorophyllide A dehydrogenase [Microbulbifer hydrolyticus]QHQ38727.1 zinc-binding dehydrogenase [Microbulbifer hydrolyticus]
MSTMQSVVLRDGKVQLESQEIPKPGLGQVLVKSLACGICGSDLHLAHHTDEIFELYQQLGMLPAELEVKPDIMLGHEFAAEVVEYGPETQAEVPVGTRVTSVPILMSQNGAGIGVTPGIHGAYSEYFLLDEALMLPLPEGVTPQAAAITEPLAVGLHAVNRSDIGKNDVALVAGCGPIGLAVISALCLRGIKHIVASDPQPNAQALAKEFGASVAVNPMETDEVARAAELAGEGRVVIYECAGIRQLLDSFIRRAPQHASLIVTGVHTEPTAVNFAFAMVKEMDIKFTYYYTPEEFSECLQTIARGEVNWKALWTGTVGIDGVPAAFETLTQPNDHIKVIVEPWRSGGLEKAE